MVRQLPPQSTCLFRPQIKRKILLLLVENSQLTSLGVVDDCEDTSDGFAEVMAE